MKYWVNLFTWNTWQEFIDAGANISGFQSNRWRTVQKIQPGDLLLCYMTGLSRFFAVLEVIGKPFRDDSQIWSEADFSSRVPVRVVMSLSPEHAIPVKSLGSQLSYFQDMKSPNSWSGHFRGSPVEESKADAQVIIDALTDAEQNPIVREFDPKKLKRKANIYQTKSGSVSIPENDEADNTDIENHQLLDDETIAHEEIQWLLLNVGQQMSLSLWVANNDKNKSFDGQHFSELSGLRDTLPVQFDQATN